VKDLLRVEQPGEQPGGVGAPLVAAAARDQPEDQVVVTGERPVQDERQDVGDVVDERVAAGRNHEVVGAVGALGLESVDRLDRGCGDSPRVGGAEDAADRELLRARVEEPRVAVDGPAVRVLVDRDAGAKESTCGDLQHELAPQRLRRRLPRHAAEPTRT